MLSEDDMEVMKMSAIRKLRAQNTGRTKVLSANRSRPSSRLLKRGSFRRQAFAILPGQMKRCSEILAEDRLSGSDIPGITLVR